MIGKSVPRVDIPAKVTGGAAYVQDLRLARHGACARGAAAELWRAADASATPPPSRRLPGVVKVVRDGNFLAVVAEREFQAVKAMRALAAAAKWEETREPARSRTICCERADRPAVAGHRDSRAQQSRRGRGRENARGDLHAALSDARLDRTVLRGRAIRRRRA